MAAKPVKLADLDERRPSLRAADPSHEERTSTHIGIRHGPSLARSVVALGILVLLLAIFYFNTRRSADLAGQYAYQVGEPGAGDEALAIRLPSTTGETFDLISLRGEAVLLYFQEGLMCQPCWDQLKEIEQSWQGFRDLGIDEIVTITTDPIDALGQKVSDEGLRTPALSDLDPMFFPEKSVQEAYDTNKYGMMGKMHSGHTFIVVGPDGKILWRADYGGAPDYTMDLPVRNLLADMKEGLKLSREAG